jgi:U3 small nucleolar RNA-associated protein 25
VRQKLMRRLLHRTRTRVLKNNEVLAHANGTISEDVETRDQGFTRPKVLILVPFRNSASKWLDLLTTLSLASSVENRSRFDADFALPEGTADKLAGADAASKYPADHIATFAGNIDDSFRVGLKITRKTIKCYSEFYQSDIIIASPLGLRVSIEKEKDADFLSSLEVLTMQNWEHVQVSVLA